MTKRAAELRPAPLADCQRVRTLLLGAPDGLTIDALKANGCSELAIATLLAAGLATHREETLTNGIRRLRVYATTVTVE